MYGRGGNVSFGPPVTPTVIKQLMIANAVVFAISIFSPSSYESIAQFGAVRPAAVWEGFRLWQPFTYMWLHADLMHVGFNMLALWMFGSQLALVWGEERFLRYYLVCGVGAGVLIATVPYLFAFAGVGANLYIPTLGASGAVMGTLLAFSFTWPDRTLMLIFPPIPIKAIWIIPFILVMEFASGPSNVSHVGHIGGVLVGWLYLVQEGRTPNAVTWNTLKRRWHRYRMQQRLRAVHEEARREQRERDDRDQRYH